MLIFPEMYWQSQVASLPDNNVNFSIDQKGSFVCRYFSLGRDLHQLNRTQKSALCIYKISLSIIIRYMPLFFKWNIYFGIFDPHFSTTHIGHIPMEVKSTPRVDRRHNIWR
jgi:hypothetical protein